MMSQISRKPSSATSRVATNYDSKALASLRYQAQISGGVPARKRIVFRYNQFNGFASGAAIRRQVWRANSLFDPDLTGTGAQPYNFDDWSTLYNRYMVRATGIRVEVVPNANLTQNWSLVVGISNASGSYSFNDLLAMPGSKVVSIPIGTSGKSTSIELHATTKAVLGDDKREGLQAQTSANPADIWYLHTYVCADDGVDTSFAGFLRTELFFDCDMYDRNVNSLDLQIRKLRNAARQIKEKLAEAAREKIELKLPDDVRRILKPDDEIGGEELDQFHMIDRQLLAAKVLAASTNGGKSTAKAEPRTPYSR